VLLCADKPPRVCVILNQDATDEVKFTDLLRHIYRRHANVVPVMAKVGRAQGGRAAGRLCWP